MSKSHFDLNFHRGVLLRTLGLNSKIPANISRHAPNIPCYKFPPELEDKSLRLSPAFIGNFDIVIYSGKESKSHNPQIGSSGYKSSAHRVFVQCKCGKEVPCGRMGQHKCDFWPRRNPVDAQLRMAREIPEGDILYQACHDMEQIPIHRQNWTTPMFVFADWLEEKGWSESATWIREKAEKWKVLHVRADYWQVHHLYLGEYMACGSLSLPQENKVVCVDNPYYATCEKCLASAVR